MIILGISFESMKKIWVFNSEHTQIFNRCLIFKEDIQRRYSEKKIFREDNIQKCLILVLYEMEYSH